MPSVARHLEAINSNARISAPHKRVSRALALIPCTTLIQLTELSSSIKLLANAILPFAALAMLWQSKS